MNVIFGINNDDTVKGIVEFYEAKYKEKIEYKNVYYFKQFVQELSTGKYDRAVLLEELEKYPTNNYAQIDEYLFKNLDSMTDVFDAKKIIYIAADRRNLGDEFLSKLFNLSIYTVLTGKDRTKGKVSEAINRPYSKKDVKKYYDNVVDKNMYNTDEVPEVEIQRIIAYYKNQNGIADKYNEIFDRIATQYTDGQLKVIIKFLPADVKQYSSFNNEKYKQILASASEQELAQINQENMVGLDSNVNNSNSSTTESIAPKSVIKEDAKAVEIKKEPQIIERIVVKEAPTQSQVVTQVVEKEVVRNIYEVPKDYRKIVAFVGAPKCGSTFCVNAIGTTLARSKVKTAIVDVTRKRDSYTIYTYDNEGKRSIAAQSLKYASNGMNEPLIYDKLSIYTAQPGEDRKLYNAGKVIETVSQKNNVILVDADFSTPIDYFRLCQEIYIVQDMDVLNIPQLTLFLRELKARGVPMKKIKIVINKHVKCSLTSKAILEGISTYTSFDFNTIERLFEPSEVKCYILPFDVENYKKYIDMVYKYSNKFSSFTDDFRQGLYALINSIYPIGNMNSTSTSVSKKTTTSTSGNVPGFKSLFKKQNTTNSGFEKEIQ